MQKKAKNVISIVHNGLILYYTRAALTLTVNGDSKNRMIGFYFDDLGLPQPIQRRSVWGEFLIRTEGEEE